MSRVLVVNGPNLNLLGSRRPEVYGATSLAELDAHCVAWGAELGFEIETFQSNHEGALIDRLHAARTEAVGVVVNPGALTHYSYALHDAIEAIELPTVEVHISNIRTREPWRRHSVVAPACVASIFGRGIQGYGWALRHLEARLAWPPTTVAYGEGPDQVGDLRVPDGGGPHPVAVVLHGGFWRDPWTRDLMDRVAVDLTRRGWATWNLEYHRVGAGGGWPATFEDVAAGVDAVTRLPDLAGGPAFELDPDRVVTLGHSAGGHLALWAAARHRLPATAPGASPQVRPTAAVAMAPVADLAAAHAADLDNGAVEALLRRGPADGPERYAVTSPAELLPLGVRQLLFHGDHDDRVPVEQSRRYVEAARAAGDDVAFHELAGVGHFEFLDPTDAAWGTVAAAIDDLLG